MKLVIFDIDGTLTDTMKTDGACYTRAYDELFGGVIQKPLHHYTHVTDPGVFTESFRQAFGRDPTGAEMDRFRNRFAKLLRENVEADPEGYRQIPGAAGALSLLLERGCSVALATGAWGFSARMKLAAAGICWDGLAIATGDDSPSREEILRIAQERAAGPARHEVFDGILCVGDGIWDVRAARNLGLPIIGIGSNARADRLRAEGADATFADYLDAEGFLACCEDLLGSRP